MERKTARPPADEVPSDPGQLRVRNRLVHVLQLLRLIQEELR